MSLGCVGVSETSDTVQIRVLVFGVKMQSLLIIKTNVIGTLTCV